MYRVYIECTLNARRMLMGGCAEYGRDKLGTRSGQPRGKVEMTTC